MKNKKKIDYIFIQTSRKLKALSLVLKRSSEQTLRVFARKLMPFGHELFIAILFIAIFLRTYKLTEIFGFSAELGDNLLDVKNAIVEQKLPLLGPPTSHPWLYFSPLFFWILTPWLMLHKFHPVAISSLGAFAGILGVYFNYKITKIVFNNKVAIISTFLQATSSFFVQFSRSGRFMFWVLVFLYLFIYTLFEIDKGRVKYIFWAGLVIGIMLNFHLTSVVLLPVALVILIRKKFVNIKYLKNLFLGIFFPLLPFFIQDAKRGFGMTVKFFIWIPYRLLGFLGVIPKNTINTKIATATTRNIIDYFSVGFIQKNGALSVTIALTIVFYLLKNIKNKDFGWVYIKWAFLFGILALFIHTQPPIHYFVPILSLPILIFSDLLSKLYDTRVSKILVVLLLVAISAFNFKRLFSKEYYFRNQLVASGDPISVPYNVQKKIIKRIVADAKNSKIYLKRVGPHDEFEANFAQNYQYLLWWMGNEPVRVGDVVVDKTKEPTVKYTIYEDVSKLPKENGSEIFWTSNIAVVKEVIK